MSNKGSNGKGGKLLPIIIILLLMGGGGLAPVMIGLSVVLGFVAIAALVIALIVKALKGTDEVTVTKKNGTKTTVVTQPTKNPYSVNYDKVLVEQTDAEKQRLKEAEEASKAAKANKETKANPVTAPVKEVPKHRVTGDPDIDKMIVEKDEAIEKMKILDEAIEDEKLSAQIVHLESVTEKIVNYTVEHPKKKKQLGKFFDYYLPTTLKLLEAYGRMDQAGISGTNIDSTKEKVEGMMDTALAAFDKQLDALYADEALDVSTDITVMQNMLKSEGLTEDDITLTL